jgi:hypothetical protein
MPFFRVCPASLDVESFMGLEWVSREQGALVLFAYYSACYPNERLLSGVLPYKLNGANGQDADSHDSDSACVAR